MKRKDNPPIADGPGSPLIELTDVTKVYQLTDVEVRALDGVTTTIRRGEMTAIMGSSGSGKSTLMNILGCLDRPTAGRYRLAGMDVTRLSRSQLATIRNRTVGFVFQSFNLLRRTSALENVELPLLYAGVGGRERARRARQSLERVGLGDRLDHWPNQMSGGQQQRVAVARALVTEPELILADEPTGNLDSRTTVEIMKLFRELHNAGMTIVLVTHEPEVAAHASRILWVRDGRIARDEAHVAGARLETTALLGGEVAA